MTITLQKINWSNFKLKNENSGKAFEDLCYHLFCRKYHQVEGIRVDYNQKGLETYPIKKGREFIGFQSKFFENKLSDKSSIAQIVDSVTKAKSTYPELTKILIYTHKSFGAKEASYKVGIENKAAPIKIEWVVESNFQSLLTKPSNLDLAQLYFGVGNEIGFIKESVNSGILTLLQSSAYIPLPLTQSDNKIVKDLKTEILGSSGKEFLISGSPGSGKSILMQKLFQLFAGLDQVTDNKMRKTLITQGAIPMLVNLKHCTSESLESILRGRQTDNNIRGQKLNFIYLFDGLDELNEIKVIQALSYIYELSQNPGTAKIILSCRSGSLNRLRAKSYLKNIIDFKVLPLSYNHIEVYFKAKADNPRIEKAKIFKQKNEALLNEIKDILLLSIFWEVIEELPLNCTFIDLLDKKINLLLFNPLHRNNIEELNLLNPKESEILSLNQDISFFFQRKFQFRFPQSELQKVISNKFPRLDYFSINSVLNYITHLFFDNDYAVSTKEYSYIYLHRRYQEFFFAQKLKKKYEKDPNILRKTKILSSHDFFESLFLPYLRSEYTRENNLIGFIGLNLIDVYLGNHRGWGADTAFYKDSKPFIEALAIQNDYTFEQIVNDENLEVKEKIFIKIPDLIQAFKDQKKSKNIFREYDYQKEIWEDNVAKLVRLNSELHKNRKFGLQDEVDRHLAEIREVFRKEKFIENFKKIRNDFLEDPFCKEWENYLYHRVAIRKDTPKEVYENYITDNYRRMKDSDFQIGEEQGKVKLVKGYIRVCLSHKRAEFLEIIPSFDEYQFYSLLEVLTEFAFLPYFFQDAVLQELVKNTIEISLFKVTKFNAAFVFFKKILKKIISEDELTTAKKEFKALEEKREIDMRLNNTQYRCAVLSYIYDRYSFELFLDRDKNQSLRFYNELGIFCTLYRDYVNMLGGHKNLMEICGDFNRYINFYTKGLDRHYLINDLTLLWSHIFTYANVNPESKRSLAKIIVKENNNIEPFEFYLSIKRAKPELYFSLIKESDLGIFESKLFESEDFFQDYIDRCFEMSIMFSGINENKSLDYFIRGINDGILRHGWRKDYIVSYLLVDAFEIIFKNKWDTPKRLKKYAEEVFDLTIRVRNITDGKGTHHGPYTLIETIALYDQKMAESLQSELKEKIGGYSNSTTAEIIKAKISAGLSMDEIEEEIGKLRKGYDHDGKPESNYYLQKFKIYFEIAKNLFYSVDERKLAFENTYQQIEDIQKQQYRFIDFKNTLHDEMEDYKTLCQEYGKKYNISEVSDDDKYSAKKYDAEIESKFLENLFEVKNEKGLNNIYSRLYKYENNIQLPNFESWKKIVEKTFEIMGTITPFLDYLKKNSYPHTDYITTNAKYCHFGMAAALGNINTRKEMIEYLSKYSGHGGFVNIMKAYEVLRDRVMCLNLFNRFLQFCKLLVY